jgi:hypothetical protein
MDGFENLCKFAGEWSGPNRVHPDISTPADECVSRITLIPILKHKFLRLDQEWSWQGEPQAGCMLIGYLPKEQRATIYWIDTWHNGRRAMSLAGQFDADGKLTAYGTFPVQDGPDWGWRIEIQGSDDALVMNMFCINPANGNEEGWVWGRFTRTST